MADTDAVSADRFHLRAMALEGKIRSNAKSLLSTYRRLKKISQKDRLLPRLPPTHAFDLERASELCDEAIRALPCPSAGIAEKIAAIDAASDLMMRAIAVVDAAAARVEDAIKAAR